MVHASSSVKAPNLKQRETGAKLLAAADDDLDSSVLVQNNNCETSCTVIECQGYFL